MAAPWIRLPETASQPAEGIGRRWREVLARSRGSRSAPDRHLASQCFGRLTAGQERIVEGIAGERLHSGEDRLER